MRVFAIIEKRVDVLLAWGFQDAGDQLAVMANPGLGTTMFNRRRRQGQPHRWT
jgi:hypothetical protein